MGSRLHEKSDRVIHQLSKRLNRDMILQDLLHPLHLARFGELDGVKLQMVGAFL